MKDPMGARHCGFCREAAKRMISNAYTGKLHLRTAAGLAPLLHLQLRTIEQIEFEDRIARAEQRINKLQTEVEADEAKINARHALGKRPAFSRRGI